MELRRVALLILVVASAGCTTILGDFTATSGDAGDDATTSNSHTDAEPEDADAAQGADAATSAARDGATDQTSAPDAASDGGGRPPMDASIEGAPSSPDAASDASGDAENGSSPPDSSAASDASMDAGSPRPTIYALTVTGTIGAGGIVQPSAFENSIARIDVTTGQAAQVVTLNGAIAIGYRSDGSVVAAVGRTRDYLAIMDGETLAVTSAPLLPWDPINAVFSPDGAFMYATHGSAYLSQVRVADATVMAEILLPTPVGTSGAPIPTGLAIDPTGTFLGLTFATSASAVSVIHVAPQMLTVAWTSLSTLMDASGCLPGGSSPSFDRAATRLATFDSNCGAFHIYDVATGQLDTAASAVFARPVAGDPFLGTIPDALGQFWAPDDTELYRTSLVDAAAQAMFPFPSGTGVMVTDLTGKTLYAFKFDSRRNGIATLDPATGVLTQLAWDLSLMPVGVGMEDALYVVR